jgi:hypothetical protein
MPKLIVVYRDNDLFSTYVPAILERLPREVEVKTYIYPAGTDPSDILDDMSEKIPAEQPPYMFLSDWTCSPEQRGNEIAAEALGNSQVRKLERLDMRFRRITERAIGKDFVPALQNIVKSFNTSPGEICVVEQSLCDHLDGYDELKKEFGHGVNPYRPPKTQELAAYIKDKLEQAFPGVPVSVAPKFEEIFEEKARETGRKARQQIDFPEPIIVADRHACGIAVMEPDGLGIWEHLTVLRLPLYNAVHDLVTMGKIGGQFDHDQIYQEIFAGVDFTA